MKKMQNYDRIFSLFIRRYYNENKKHISIFEKAVYMGELIKSGRITKNELADSLGINLKSLEKKLSILNLSEDERKVIINHSFDEEFIFIFLGFDEEKRQEILNKIIVKNFTNSEAKKYLEELKKPEIKPIKTAQLTSDKIILNRVGSRAFSAAGTGSCPADEGIFHDGVTAPAASYRTYLLYVATILGRARGWPVLCCPSPMGEIKLPVLWHGVFCFTGLHEGGIFYEENKFYCEAAGIGCRADCPVCAFGSFQNSYWQYAPDQSGFLCRHYLCCIFWAC